jgi:hypothetical protein
MPANGMLWSDPFAATEEYLAQRAERGDRTRFERAMSKAADVSPPEYDR